MSPSKSQLAVLVGWKSGLRTIDLMRLIADRTSLKLSEAKAAVERLVDGEHVAFAFTVAREAERFLEDAERIGAIGRLGG